MSDVVALREQDCWAFRNCRSVPLDPKPEPRRVKLRGNSGLVRIEGDWTGEQKAAAFAA